MCVTRQLKHSPQTEPESIPQVDVWRLLKILQGLIRLRKDRRDHFVRAAPTLTNMQCRAM